MLPMPRSTGYRCPSCCAKKGEPHLVDCKRPQKIDSFSLTSTGFLIGDCVLVDFGEPDDSLSELRTPDEDTGVTGGVADES